ncbi:MAG TPA: isocitrate/isopropylmalate dehydrogenase family protein, partial [Vicinamibacterales bacterium]|nr:isocitrate/isopropylmalate dehydrogenase family protein [Vicinamibacterales bacterium]
LAEAREGGAVRGQDPPRRFRGVAVRFAIIAGDGIGKEVTAEAVRVLARVADVYGRTFEFEHLPWGADYFLETGITLPPNGYEMLRDDFDAIFIGALGDPRVPDNRHARDILLGTRFELDLYVNYRPVKLIDARLCPLKNRGPEDINFVVFRENTEGLYVSVGGRFKPGTDDEIAIQEELNTFKGVNRIVRHAFEFARGRGLTKVCMADKSNAMQQGHALWQRVFKAAAADYPEIEATHYFIDALAMYMVLDPGQFQVIVTNNLFGDIVTDLAATFQGGLGMAASGNIHPGRTSMFEPVHGSAPRFAGKNIANPIGAISSAALMLETLGLQQEAAAIEAAVSKAVRDNQVTSDIGGTLGTREAGGYIMAQIASRPDLQVGRAADERRG